MKATLFPLFAVLLAWGPHPLQPQDADVVAVEFDEIPNVYVDHEPLARDVSQGTLNTVWVRLDAFGSDALEGRIKGTFGDPAILFSSDAGKTGTPEGEGERGTTHVSFLIFVGSDAKLGPRDLKLTWGDRAVTIPGAIRVVRPLVIVLDIDGLRESILYDALKQGRLPTLGKIFGSYRDQANLGALGVDRYEHGLGVREATTIFPSYTFAGHAAIFTGRQPGEFGIPGNEWFDRRGGDARRYAFTTGFGDEWKISGAETRDVKGSFFGDLANSLLRRPTVYDDLGRLGIQSIVGFNMYFGTDREHTFRIPYSMRAAVNFGTTADAKVCDELVHTYVLDAVARPAEAMSSYKWQGLDIPQVGVLTFYPPGLDHEGHSRGVLRTQAEHLQYLDTLFAELLKRLSPGVVGHALWIVTSDHGQTDAGGIVTPRVREKMRRWGYRVEGLDYPTLWGILPTRIGGINKRPPKESNCVVGYNGGLSHIYLRRDDLDSAGDLSWDLPPRDFDVEQTAFRIAEESRTGGWKGQIDLVLMRPPDGNFRSEYRAVVSDSRSSQWSTISIDDYLGRQDCVFYDARYGWKPSDRNFLKAAILGMNCDRSGDVVMFPHYPDVILEVEHLPGAHGSLTRNDMLVPLAVARRSLKNSDSLERLVKESIRLDSELKPTASNRDVPAIILNYHRQRVRLEAGREGKEEGKARLPKVSGFSVRYSRAEGAAPVRTVEAYKDPGKGDRLYEQEELTYEITYTVEDPGTGLIEIAGRFGFIECSGFDSPSRPMGERGAHRLRAKGGAPLAGETREDIPILYGGLYGSFHGEGGKSYKELARGAPIVLSGFARGWGLKEVIPKADKGDRETDKRTKTGKSAPDEPPWKEEEEKTAHVGVEKGRTVMINSVRHVETGGSQPSEYEIAERLWVDGFSKILLDTKKYDLTHQEDRTRKVVPPETSTISMNYRRFLGGTMPEVYRSGRNTDWIRIDDPNLSPIALDLSNTLNNGRPKSSSLDFVLRVKEWTDHPLQATLILRYVRLDESHDGQPIDWPVIKFDGYGQGGATSIADSGPEPRTNRPNQEDAPEWVRESVVSPAIEADEPSSEPTESERRKRLLRAPAPWLEETIRGLIDTWLRISHPDIDPSGPEDKRVWIWDPWGQPHCPPSVELTGIPEHGGMDRYEFLYRQAARLRSRRHYTLREFLERRLRGDLSEEPEKLFRSPIKGLMADAVKPSKTPIERPPEVGHAVGSTAPEVALNDYQGRAFRLSQQKGKVVVLTSMFGRCDPAFHSIAAMEKMAKTVGADRLSTVAVASGLERDDVLKWYRKHGFSPDTLRDGDFQFGRDFAIQDPHTLFLIDTKGILRYRSQESKAVQSAEFRKVLKELIPEVDWEKVLEEAAPVKPPPVGNTVGSTAPQIALNDLDGKPFRLSDQKGKIVVIVNDTLHRGKKDASWMQPAVETFYRLEQVASPEKLKVIAVTQVPKRDVVDCYKKWPQKATTLLDVASLFWKDYGLRKEESWTWMVIVDGDGIIRMNRASASKKEVIKTLKEIKPDVDWDAAEK